MTKKIKSRDLSTCVSGRDSVALARSGKIHLREEIAEVRLCCPQEEGAETSHREMTKVKSERT